MQTLLVGAGGASARIRLSDLRLQWRESLQEVLVDGRPMITEGDDSTRLSQPESSHQGRTIPPSQDLLVSPAPSTASMSVLIALLMSIKCSLPTLSIRTGVMKRVLWPYGETLRCLSISCLEAQCLGFLRFRGCSLV